GMLWSPAGLNEEGFTLKLLLSGGVYSYISSTLDDSTVLSRQYSVTAMYGWRIKRPNYQLTVFAGFDLQDFKSYPFDPNAHLIGRYLGPRAAFELWYEPSPTMMLAADGSVSAISAGDYARIAYGWRLFDKFYFGPEAQLYYTEPYSHKRVGVHVT